MAWYNDVCGAGKSGYMGNFIQAGAEHYTAWGRLAQAIQEDRPMNPRPAGALPTLPADRINVYVERRYELSKRHAVAIAERLHLRPVQQGLDVAGGSEIYSLVFAQRQGTLQATVVDLPTTVPFAQAIIAR